MRKHLGLNNAWLYGLRCGDSCIAACHGLLCVVGSNQVGSSMPRGSYDLLYHHTLHNWNKTRYIASYRAHRVEVIRLLCVFLKAIKISLND